MTTTENIRDWFLTCPAVKAIMEFNIDYLGDEPNGCAVYSIPSTLTYSEDITGLISFRGVQSLNFVFALRANYSDDVQKNIDNLKFFDDVKEWMYKQNTSKNLPKITEGEVKSIMPTQTEFISSAGSDTAMYEMRCELKYWRED